MPEPPGPDDAPFYAPIGDFQGALYARNAFAKGTEAEAAALLDHLDLGPGDRVLDVGCGNARHLVAMARVGVHGVGVDISQGLVDAANAAAESAGVGDLVTVLCADARALPDDLGTFDAALSVCQGGFGTGPTADAAVLAGLVDHLRPGGRLALTAFHAAFAVRHLVAGDAYDATRDLHHQRAEVVGPDGDRRTFDLWTTAYTVRDLVGRLEHAGLEVLDVVGAEPGRYAGTGVRLDDPELLVVARRPATVATPDGRRTMRDGGR